MTLPEPIKRFTPAEYYALEREAAYKSDYYNGEIFAMASGTSVHSLICSNVVGELNGRLRKTPCTTYESNLRLKVKATGLRCYPDANVYCEPLERDPDDSAGETYVNPTVLFEVLSKTTDGYDRGFKAENYRRIAALKAYVFISQESPHIEIYERQLDGTWVLRERAESTQQSVWLLSTSICRSRRSTSASNFLPIPGSRRTRRRIERHPARLSIASAALTG